jgi:hypothetical protein
MKEINDKTLSKIYSGYIGSKIELSQGNFSEDEEDTVFTLDGVYSGGFYIKETGIKYEFCPTDSILVCHLRNITDEDAIEVAKLNVTMGINFEEKDSVNEVINYVKKVLIHYMSINIKSYQYLQSKGYALPYMDYSVENLLELGVYALK